ncbi:MAG: YicC family protein [Gammaproteobacteria bacterium]|nr:YicC family protein [Gammaproteobacteria bacterium]
MLMSMTAFAREQMHDEDSNATCELRSVNHRYLECKIRLPEALRHLEPAIQTVMRKTLSRGKVDCILHYQTGELTAGHVQFNQKLYQHILHIARNINAELVNPADMSALDLMKWPGVMECVMGEQPERDKKIIALVTLSLQSLLAVRKTEGQALKKLLQQRLTLLSDEISYVGKVTIGLVDRQRQRLVDKVASLAVDLEPSRLEQEIALLAQRMDVSEELDRLTTHVIEVEHILTKDEPVGRRLDFFMQELNREANTLTSKIADSEVTQHCVEMKVLIEQMREQIQNLE